MKPKPKYDIENIEYKLCRERHLYWIDFLANESRVLFPGYDLKSDRGRLLDDFNVSYEYGINATCLIDGTISTLGKIKPNLIRFLGVARLIEKELREDGGENLVENVDPKCIERRDFEYRKNDALNELDILQKEYLANPNQSTAEKFEEIADTFRFLEFDLQDPNTIKNARIDFDNLNLIEVEEHLEEEHFKPHFYSRPEWLDEPSTNPASEIFFSSKALNAFVKARYLLDFMPYVSVEDIAILAGVSRRTVTNATNSNDPHNSLKLASEFSFRDPYFGTYDHLVDAESAKAWLIKRDMFHETNQEGSPYIQLRHNNLSYLSKSNSNIDIYTVPKARDGSLFSPSCSSRKGYTIGPIGDEEQVSSFEEALEKLNKMKKPYWRRRNKKGRLGTVAGVTWVEVSKSKLFPD